MLFVHNVHTVSNLVSRELEAESIVVFDEAHNIGTHIDYCNVLSISVQTVAQVRGLCDELLA